MKGGVKKNTEENILMKKKQLQFNLTQDFGRSKDKMHHITNDSIPDNQSHLSKEV